MSGFAWSVTMVALVLFVRHCPSLEEGSGFNQPTDDDDATILIDPPSDNNVIHHLLSTYERTTRQLMNATIQLELIRAENELARGRITLHLWIHESWIDPRLVFPEGTKLKKLLLTPAELLRRIDTPETVVKNSLYFKLVKSPLPNGFVTLHSNGSVSSHVKVVVDLPCQRQYVPRNERDTAPHHPSSYATNGYHHKEWQNRCVLALGSYVRPTSLLQLRWDSVSGIIDHKIPCGNTRVVDGRSVGTCHVLTTTTYLQADTVAGEVFDELVAEFQIESPYNA